MNPKKIKWWNYVQTLLIYSDSMKNRIFRIVHKIHKQTRMVNHTLGSFAFTVIINSMCDYILFH